MDIQAITFGSGMITSSGSIDEEHKRIIEKLISLGLSPTGSKANDKAKLHEYEIRQVKTELGSKGNGSVNTTKYITVSTQEIERLKEQLKTTEKDENSLEYKEKEDATKLQTGATQIAALNKWFLKKSPKTPQL